MWYVMPTGEEASREAASRDIRDRLESIRCAAMLITRLGARTQDRELGNVILHQLASVESAVSRLAFPLPLHRLR